MNIKRFLATVVVPVILLAGLFASSGINKSSSVEAQKHVVAPKAMLITNEPAIRMWSGAIQFTDGNYPDFKPHAQTSAKQTIMPRCITDEQVASRRVGGCIQ